METKHILIVEDDNEINQLLAEILRQNHYQVTQAFSGTEARLLLEQTYFSLVLLDLMLPGMSGEELLPVIRKRSAIPVIILSAKDTSQDKIQALKSGADDYITKPFDEGELLARLEANLRRSGQALTAAAATVCHREISLNRENRTVAVNSKPVSLTSREFNILELMMSNPKKVFTKSNLYSSVWKDEFFGDDNTINVHISKLRTKLGNPDYIQTVWGIGFKMN